MKAARGESRAAFPFMSETTKENPAPAPAPIAAVNSIETATPAKPVSASDLTAPLIAGMPEVTGGSEPKETPLPDPGTAPLPGFEIKDDFGTVFNPAEHKADEKGNPVKNKAGRFYSKFIGRAGSARKAGVGQIGDFVRDNLPADGGPKDPPTFEGAPGGTVPAPSGGEMSRAEPQPDPADGMALMLIPTIDGVMQSLFSEGVALSNKEKEIMQPVAAAYLRSKGAKDIPPGLALTMVAVAIYGPKFQKPTVKERITLIALKLKTWFARK